ncbi:DUF1178 domain-containing protein [Sphingomonas antarctica]|uniref:DUF1178 family protein n=1 Tax=Sphingomonas antarctica TaxID=2040274 RepID=UPI0039ED86D2
MIVIDVACTGGHRFEGWFASSDAFEDQRARALVACPTCGDTDVERALSVPRIAGKRSNDAPSPKQMLATIAAMQAASLKDSTWVGKEFAGKARDMADGAIPQATIHGEATPAEAKALREDGVAVMPLLCPVVKPSEVN